MAVTLIRVIVAAFGGLLMLAGIALVATGGPGSFMAGLVIFGIGAALLIAVVVERTRYRSAAAERSGAPPGPGGGEPEPPEPRFLPTGEVFVDPTTSRRMRVLADPRTGERRYVAES